MSRAVLAKQSAYDAYAFAQRWAAGELMRFIGSVEPGAIFEAGCGTGIYTRMLAQRFPHASIRAVDLDPATDIVWPGGAATGRINILVADAEGEGGGSYDLVTSNAVFHWFKRPEATLAKHASMLSAEGMVAFSCFGPETYRELDAALVETFGGEVRTVASRFADSGVLEKLMRSSFTDFAVEQRRLDRTFDSIVELLRCVKHTRTNDTPGGGAFWTRGRMAEVERIYVERSGAVTATYQVFLCRGSL